MELGRLGPGELLAALGGVAVLVALFLLPWYGVGEEEIAPIEIERDALRAEAGPSLYAQAEPPGPGEPPAGPAEPQEPGLPGEPQMGIPPENLPTADLPEDLGAWEAQGPLGTLANVVILVAALAALRVAITGVRHARRPGLPGAATTALGAAALVAVALRMLFVPDGVDDVEFEATLEIGIFVALLGAAAIAIGGLLIARAQAAGSPGAGPRRPAPPGASGPS